MAPPWKVYPQLVEASLGWNMGLGECYRHEFRAWFRGIEAAQREAYQRVNAEPAGWQGYYSRLLRRTL